MGACPADSIANTCTTQPCGIILQHAQSVTDSTAVDRRMALANSAAIYIQLVHRGRILAFARLTTESNLPEINVLLLDLGMFPALWGSRARAQAVKRAGSRAASPPSDNLGDRFEFKLG
jgi:hypothetical protein